MHFTEYSESFFVCGFIVIFIGALGFQEAGDNNIIFAF